MHSLTESQQDYLLNQPESGMGYQFVDVVTEADGHLAAVAYNAELVLATNEPDHQALLEAYAKRSSFHGAQGSGVREITVLSREAYAARMSAGGGAPGTPGVKAGLAKDAPMGATKSGEVFKRFTAFKTDRRLRLYGGYTPGTYATTEEDARNIRTGQEAVARSALPNPAPAVHVFTIAPSPDTKIQSGIVAAAHGQPGGGVEVIFTQGTTARTVSGPTRIPRA